MSQSRIRLTAVFLIAFCLALLPCGYEGDGNSRATEQSIKKGGVGKSRLIVLPFQPQENGAYYGIGLGVHFLLGNVVALHTGFKEFWFGWRVKKIFLEKEKLRAYCRGEGLQLDISNLGKEQEIRYWLRGKVKQQGSKIQVALILRDTKGKHDEWSTELTLEPEDQLIGFRKGFLAWLETCGFYLPEAQAAKALWPEKTTIEGLDLLGRALETFYLHSSWGDKGPVDLNLLNRAVSAAPASYLAHDLRGWILYKNKDYQAADDSFRSALKLNPNGLGAMAGLMWCAIYTNDEEEAYKWAIAKADLRGESRDAAKASVARRISKYSK